MFLETEIYFYIILCLALSNPALSIPLKSNPEPETKNDFEVNPQEIVLIPVRLMKREIIFEDTSDLNSLGDIGDSSESSDDRVDTSDVRYSPYFRYRKIYTSEKRPKYPLSNYADDYDRFPTIF